MRLWIDEYARLDSPLHRLEPRLKLVVLLAVAFAFSLVRDLRLVPIMFAITAGLYALSRLPVSFLVTRLRAPGMFMLIMAVFLPFFAGQTVWVRLGPLAVREEGVLSFLLIASRFVCILTVGLILFGTAPFTTTVRAMERLGMPSLLANMTLLSFRYLFEIGDNLARMETAMRLRGFRAGRLSWRGLRVLAALAGSLLIRSFEQAERVYKAMKLRGYGHNGRTGSAVVPSSENGADAALLAVSHLSFAYPGGEPVFEDVSFAIAPGERVGIIGPNGAGKTSLFLVISGVLKPTSGVVQFTGEPVRFGDFRPQIGLVFQNADDQLFSPSVRDDIAFGPANMGLPEHEVMARVEAMLDGVGIRALADRPPHHLSGGEKRMVAIAGVLAMQPQIVLYDEPDANLDVRARRRLITFLQQASHAFLVATHDLELILEVCDRVLVLDERRLVADGDPRVLMGDATFMEAHGLEKPHSLIPHMHALP